MPGNNQPNPWRYFGIGLEYAGVILIFMYLGYLADQWRGHQTPWFLIVGAMVGLMGGTYNLIKMAKRANDDMDRHSKNS